MTLTQFLEARLTEEEAEANLLPDDDGPQESTGISGWVFTEWDYDRVVCSDEYPHLVVEKRRWLAELAAKRATIEAAWDDYLRIEQEWGRGRDQVQLSRENDIPQALRALGLPYANHPDYRDEWRP